MQFQLPLIAVEDLERSKEFYQLVMRQTITLDLDQNVSFGGFAIQSEYDKLVGTEDFHVEFGLQNNHELYFEVDDYEECMDHLDKFPDLDYVHPTREYPWGQRVVRFYDPDGHIMEVAESMASVFHKFCLEGMTAEQIAQRTMHPVDFVRTILGREGWL